MSVSEQPPEALEPEEEGAVDPGSSLGLWGLALALLLLPPALYFGVPEVLNSRLFLVDEVSLSGNRHHGSGEILALLELDRPRNLLTLDPAAKEARLRVLPWVRDASVQIEARRRVRVEVVEREWRWVGAAGRLWLLDEEGSIIRAWRGEDGLDRPLLLGLEARGEVHASLSDPVAGVSFGEDVPRFDRERVRQAERLREAVEAALPAEGREVVQIEAEPARHWRVRLRDGAWIRLAESRLEERMERLEEVMRWTDANGRRIDYVLLDGEPLDRVTVRFLGDALGGQEENR